MRVKRGRREYAGVVGSLSLSAPWQPTDGWPIYYIGKRSKREKERKEDLTASSSSGSTWIKNALVQYYQPCLNTSPQKRTSSFSSSSSSFSIFLLLVCCTMREKGHK